jgi:glyoxylase-like metal-dependent hydrolase (beta-lactamase superfamily II)
MIGKRTTTYESQKNGAITIHGILAGIGWAYLIETQNGMVLVDAGSRGCERRILNVLAALGRDDLRLILITHAHLDHYGSADAVRRATGAPIAAHRGDANTMARGETDLGSVRGWGKVIEWSMPIVERFLRPPSTQADVLVVDGWRLDDYGLDAFIVHTPGHTPGSISLVVEGGLVFAGDLVSARGWPHAQWFYATDWSEIGTSINRIKAYVPEWIYTGHSGTAIRGNAFQKIKIPRNHRG